MSLVRQLCCITILVLGVAGCDKGSGGDIDAGEPLTDAIPTDADSGTPPQDSGTPPQCATDADCVVTNACLKGSCLDGECVETNRPDLTACGDGKVCFQGTCASEGTCGDNEVGAGELCDDGNQEGDDYCAPDCSAVIGACGDTTVQSNETCDDGNTGDGDYCAADCKTSTGSCGDGITQSNEVCDDPNYCSDDCTTVTGACGDDILQDHEACDDGNSDDDDYCAGDCTAITGHCGDKVKQSNEFCDDGNYAALDGCSPLCTEENYQTGDIIITEVMANPAVIGDAEGEWFELHNTTDHDIALNGWTVSDSGVDSKYTIHGPNPIVIPAGAFFLLTRVCEAENNGGLEQDYCYKTDDGNLDFGLNNDADSLTVNFGEMTVDTMTWKFTDGWPLEEGTSMQLSAATLSEGGNDIPGNWCLSVEAYWTSGDKQNLGTPGTANKTCD